MWGRTIDRQRRLLPANLARIPYHTIPYTSEFVNTQLISSCPIHLRAVCHSAIIGRLPWTYYSIPLTRFKSSRPGLIGWGVIDQPEAVRDQYHTSYQPPRQKTLEQRRLSTNYKRSLLFRCEPGQSQLLMWALHAFRSKWTGVFTTLVPPQM